MNELICIVCPRGCHLKVDNDLNITGNFCNRGVTYGKSEVTNPVRVITSTVNIISKSESRLPVKTSVAVSKEKIFDVMKALNKVCVKAPINAGDIIIENVDNAGSNIIATKTILE